MDYFSSRLLLYIHTHIMHSHNHMNKEPPKNNPNTKQLSSSIIFVILVVVLTQLVPFVNNVMRSWQYQLDQLLLRQQFNVTTIDDFLSDNDLDFLRKVQNDSLWRACDKITASGVVRFWYYPSNEPVNIFEELAVKIYKDTVHWDQAKAYEYWCNIVEESDDPRSKETPWHTDRDEDVLEKERKFVFPLMGAVFYGFNESYAGGYFHMIDSVPYRIGTRKRHPNDQCHEGQGMCVTNPHLFSSNKSNEALYVETKFNRLLYANVTHFHKVTKVTSGKRYALAVNANHWLPYEIEQAPSNDEMLALAEKEIETHQRTFGLFDKKED